MAHGSNKTVDFTLYLLGKVTSFARKLARHEVQLQRTISCRNCRQRDEVFTNSVANSSGGSCIVHNFTLPPSQHRMYSGLVAELLVSLFFQKILALQCLHQTAVMCLGVIGPSKSPDNTASKLSVERQ